MILNLDSLSIFATEVKIGLIAYNAKNRYEAPNRPASGVISMATMGSTNKKVTLKSLKIVGKILEGSLVRDYITKLIFFILRIQNIEMKRSKLPSKSFPHNPKSSLSRNDALELL